MPVEGIGDKSIVQIGIVVRDVEVSAAEYCKIFGLEMPGIFSASGEPRATYKGQEISAGLRGVVFDMGKLQVELLQPTDSPSAWADYLEQQGEGIHHIAFAVTNTAKAVESFAQYGYGIVQQGMFTNGEGMYTYLDTDKDMGIVVELMERFNPPPPSEPKPFPAEIGIGTNVVTQVAVLVNDIEKAKKRISEVFGLPEPPLIVTPGYEITETTYKGLPCEATAKLAFFNFGQAQLELIEPDQTPSVWRDYLNEHGECSHHIAFGVRDSEAAATYFAKHDIAVSQQGLYGDRSGMYTYLDSGSKLGALVEILESFPKPR